MRDQTATPLQPEPRVMGYEEEGFSLETVSTVTISRAEFREIVERTINRHEERYAPIADDMRELAKTIPHFPLATWISEERGCGCMIGEYLVAQPEIDRHNLAIAAGVNPYSIHDMLMARENGVALWHFGSDVDWQVRAYLARRGVAVDGEEVCTDPDDVEYYASVVLIAG